MNSFRFAALSAALCCLFALPARADLNVVATLPDLARQGATISVVALTARSSTKRCSKFPSSRASSDRGYRFRM